MNYEFTLPNDTQEKFSFSKQVAKKAVENYGKGAKKDAQKAAAMLYGKIDALTIDNNVISLTDEEQDIISNGADTFISSYTWNIMLNVPELVQELEAMEASNDSA